MTYEQMLELAEKIARALGRDLAEYAEVLKEDGKPGEPIPIAVDIDGESYFLTLDVG